MNPNRKNTTSQQIAERTDRTTNYEDAPAFNPSSKLKLYLQAATWMVGEPKFYAESGKQNQDEELLELFRTVAVEDPVFALNLTEYVRNELYLRTAPQVMLAECSLIPACKDHIRRYVPRIMKRPDDMTTCIAYLKSRIGDIGDKKESGSMPAALKRGIADAFVTFNEYQLQKYNNQRRMVKLVDVMRLVHPKPKDETQSDMFGRLKHGLLKTPETWETIISAEGSTETAWREAAKHMPYMALLRNLRNLLEHEVLTDEILERLTNAEAVQKSMQMPYRFYSAYREVAEVESFRTNDVLAAIQQALAVSVQNVPKLPGKTFITSDNSGSMDSKPSARSKITMKEIGNLSMSILAAATPSTMCSVFASEFKVVSMDKSAGVISNMEYAGNHEVGYGTEGYLALDYLIKNKVDTDRIVIFSDMQMYDSYFHRTMYEKLLEYKNHINHEVTVYSFDLSGYGTIQIPENETNVIQIGGWSDRVFEFMRLYESDHESALQKIERRDW